MGEQNKNNIVEKRLGIVKFPRPRGLKLSDIEFRKECMSVLVPLFSIYDNSYHETHYDKWVCQCNQFREVKEGEKYPEYELTFTRNINNELTLIKAEEVKF